MADCQYKYLMQLTACMCCVVAVDNRQQTVSRYQHNSVSPGVSGQQKFQYSKPVSNTVHKSCSSQSLTPSLTQQVYVEF